LQSHNAAACYSKQLIYCVLHVIPHSSKPIYDSLHVTNIPSLSHTHLRCAPTWSTLLAIWLQHLPPALVSHYLPLTRRKQVQDVSLHDSKGVGSWHTNSEGPSVVVGLLAAHSSVSTEPRTLYNACCSQRAKQAESIKLHQMIRHSSCCNRLYVPADIRALLLIPGCCWLMLQVAVCGTTVRGDHATTSTLHAFRTSTSHRPSSDAAASQHA
jgi:hypothetical protein